MTTTKTQTPNEGQSDVLPKSVTKVGNLTRDPDLRYSDKGTAFCRFAVAVSNPVTAGDWTGERMTEFYEVTVFGSLAENIAESLEKGDRVVVSGRPEFDAYQAKDGTNKTQKRVIAEAVGAELRFATCTIVRPKRTAAPHAPDSEREESF